MKKSMIDNLTNDLSAPVGGFGGAVLLAVTSGAMAEVAIYGAIGAIVGIIVREIYAWCKRYINKRL